jgi:hypothetical protein
MGTSGPLGHTTRITGQECLPSLAGQGTTMTWHGGMGRLHQHSHDARHHSRACMLAAHVSNDTMQCPGYDVKLSKVLL